MIASWTGTELVNEFIVLRDGTDKYTGKKVWAKVIRCNQLFAVDRSPRFASSQFFQVSDFDTIEEAENAGAVTLNYGRYLFFIVPE
jgi:hypothetical protein